MAITHDGVCKLLDMTLTPTQQLRVLGKIWGQDRDGFVFLPHIPGTADTVEKRKRSWKENRAFAWPEEKAAILAHLEAHTDDDLYFTPNLFSSKKRLENYAEPERVLYADLDPVDPSGLEQRPTIAWETSPGRYQGIWMLDRPRVGASWAGKENHRLSMAIGADPSGWDTTQVLRVPGRENHKPSYRESAAGGAAQLLWDNGPRYQWDDFDDLPEITTAAGTAETESLDEAMLSGVDRHEVWARVRLKLSMTAREYMAARDTGGADRSDVMWGLERDLAKAGCNMAEIIALIRPTVWNKFAGRNNELQQLKQRAAQALAVAAESPIEQVDDIPKPDDVFWLHNVVAQGIPRPKWLVRDIWARGACGFISGTPKSYKSWMGMDMCVTIASGTSFLGHHDFTVPQGPQPVLMLQEEDDLRLVVDRLATIIEARDPGMFWQGKMTIDNGVVSWEPPAGTLPIAVHVATGFIASDEGWQAWLDDAINKHRFSFVLIDTLGTTAGSVDTDRSSDVMTKMLTPLKVLAKKHDCAIAIVHHNRKEQSATRAGQSMLGSVALHAWVESALYVRTKDGGSLVVERETKNAPDRTLNIDVPHMFASPSGDRVLWDPQVLAEEPDTRNASDDARTHTPPAQKPSQGRGRVAGSSIAWELANIGGKRRPMTAEEIANIRGKSLTYTTKSLDQAVANGLLTKSDAGYMVKEES